jgi:hypothetical protein
VKRNQGGYINPMIQLPMNQGIGEWRSKAACKGVDTGKFYPEHAGRYGAGMEAVAICSRCPVRKECADAGDSEHHGIWGGMAPTERKFRRRAELKKKGNNEHS